MLNKIIYGLVAFTSVTINVYIAACTRPTDNVFLIPIYLITLIMGVGFAVKFFEAER